MTKPALFAFRRIAGLFRFPPRGLAPFAAVLFSGAAAMGAGLHFGFVGLHGGVFAALQEFAPALEIKLTYCTVEDIRQSGYSFQDMDVVFLQHLRTGDKDRYVELLTAAKAANPQSTALTCSGLPGALLPELVQDGIVVDDPEIHRFYGSSRENLRRMLACAAIRYGGRSGTIEPPVDEPPVLVFHPDHPEGFPDLAAFEAWAADRRPDAAPTGRALVIAHPFHLAFQQTPVVEALVRELERRNLWTVCITDGTPGWEEREKEFQPDVVVHTCHGSETSRTRLEVDAPHFSSLYTKAGAMETYLEDPGTGLSPGELQHQVVSQEVLGTVEPLFVAATPQGGGGEEAVQPVPERVEHLGARVEAMVRLRKTPAAKKKVAIIYYDRSMGKSELMRGTASGMFLNAPRSLMRVLRRLRDEGLTLTHPPETEDELLNRMKDHGRQVGVWDPVELDKLVSSGNAVLLPVETYCEWFETKVPAIRREQLIRQWGPPPGNFMVWKNKGREYIVIPRVDLGNVILLPQPLRGEAHTSSAIAEQTHDRLTPPPHNYLATYFWLQESFQADAMIHFGTHGSEFLLPGKPDALVAGDWCDVIAGDLPNIGLWIVNNVGESTPLRRRSYATIIDHLTPPLVAAELSDELKNLQSDIQKWQTLEDSALRDKFHRAIADQVRNQHLDLDLKFNLSGDRLPSDDEIEQVDRYLETIANESTAVSLHVLGEAPPQDLRISYLVRCAGHDFLDAYRALLPAPKPDESEARRKAEEALAMVLQQNLTPLEALQAQGGSADSGLPKPIQNGFDLMVQMNTDFDQTTQEVDNLMQALNGRFIPPGPANSPDRNPGSIPTGRDMFVVNPEEIPAPPSWEIGTRLIDELLQSQMEQNGRYPRKIAFSLNPFSSYRDYGVIESQIFHLMGVRPVWDAKRQVEDVEVIPAAELGRPRIDVFLSARSYYRDQLPTRMTLIDKAVRRVAALDEPDNYVREDTQRVAEELEQRGMDPERARRLAGARLFGWPPGQNGSAWYYYLAEKTGEWNDRTDLMRTYLEQCQYVYTDGAWGENAPEAYERTIQGAEMVVRSWADTVSSPLANKYTWYIDGSLAQAIQHLTGHKPEFFLADVRDSDQVRMIRAEDALAADFHVRLFNRKWIEGMMKEGYAGADQVAVHVSNMLGWEIMREHSVSAENWQEVVNVYIRDSKQLHIRDWFDQNNPQAFQGVTQILMETIRKGYWTPDDATTREIAMAHAQSVVRFGKNGGIRGGNNKPFQDFIQSVLDAPGDSRAQALLAEYQAARQTVAPDPAAGTAPADSNAATPEPTLQPVEGKRLEPVPEVPDNRRRLLWQLAATAFLGLLIYGFIRRKGTIQ